MKHLFIILISFLLLSSPVIGDNHKGETLYLWETSSGRVWKGFGDKETQPKYQGDVKNGKPNGVGIGIYKDGWKYIGEWKNGKRHGQGTRTWKSVSKYVGEWKNGKRHGQGTFTKISGNNYVGEWKDGKRHGQGTGTTLSGDKYVGEWKDGEENGQGTWTSSDGSKYVGEHKDGKVWNGIGYDKNGNIEYKKVNGKYTEKGEVKKKKGVVYIGIRNGKFGDYKEKWEGVESKDNRDIGKYEGELNKHGTPHGQGIFTTPYGEKHVGVFDRGDLWTGTIYDNEGKVIFRKVKGWVQ